MTVFCAKFFEMNSSNIFVRIGDEELIFRGTCFFFGT